LTSVYRILRKPYARKPLDGEGVYRYGGRWSSPGVRLAYTSEHLSLAIIEYFVHISANDPPEDLVLVRAEVPDSVSRLSLTMRLPRNWRATPPPQKLAEIGDDFVRQRQSAILIVPSVLAPTESNWLINPRHPEFRKIRVKPAKPFLYDPRFFS
jgi:RES domain-containing protein